MTTTVYVWPASCGPAITFRDITRIIVVGDDGDIDESFGPDEKVLMLNPANAVAWAVDTNAPAPRDGALDLEQPAREA